MKIWLMGIEWIDKACMKDVKKIILCTVQLLLHVKAPQAKYLVTYGTSALLSVYLTLVVAFEEGSLWPE